jgi:hypothetical protein
MSYVLVGTLSSSQELCQLSWNLLQFRYFYLCEKKFDLALPRMRTPFADDTELPEYWRWDWDGGLIDKENQLSDDTQCTI